MSLSSADTWVLFSHFASLSLLAVGGAIATVPDMHRALVGQHLWLSDSQFNAAIALAQAAPGPNVLFVALLGWNVGLNASGGVLTTLVVWLSALTGMALAMAGMLLPSTTLTLLASRWAHRNRELRAVRAFNQTRSGTGGGGTAGCHGLDHVGKPQAPSLRDWPLWLLTLVSVVLVWRTRLHLLWLLGAGGILGGLGLV